MKVTQDIVTNHVTFQPTPTRQAMSRAQPFPYKFDTSVKLRFFRSLEEKISNGFIITLPKCKHFAILIVSLCDKHMTRRLIFRFLSSTFSLFSDYFKNPSLLELFSRRIN